MLQVEFKLTPYESIVYNIKPKLMITVYHDLSAYTVRVKKACRLRLSGSLPGPSSEAGLFTSNNAHKTDV